MSCSSGICHAHDRRSMGVGKALRMPANHLRVSEGPLEIPVVFVGTHGVGDAGRSGAPHVGPIVLTGCLVRIPDIAITTRGPAKKLVSLVVTLTIHLDTAALHHGEGQCALPSEHADRPVTFKPRVVSPATVSTHLVLGDRPWVSLA